MDADPTFRPDADRLAAERRYCHALTPYWQAVFSARMGVDLGGDVALGGYDLVRYQDYVALLRWLEERSEV